MPMDAETGIRSGVQGRIWTGAKGRPLRAFHRQSSAHGLVPADSLSFILTMVADTVRVNLQVDAVLAALARSRDVG